MFAKIEGESAILVSGGVYRSVELFERDGKLFAGFSGGYVRLYANGTTSKDKLRIDAIALDGDLYADRLGRLCVSEGEGRSLLSGDAIAPLSLSKD